MPGASSNAGESYWPAAPPPPDRCGKADLAEIWVHIASEASEAVASHIVAAIEAAFGPVRHFPLAAPAREQLASGLRATFHNPYAIYATGRYPMPWSSFGCCMARAISRRLPITEDLPDDSGSRCHR